MRKRTPPLRPPQLLVGLRSCHRGLAGGLAGCLATAGSWKPGDSEEGALGESELGAALVESLGALKTSSANPLFPQFSERETEAGAGHGRICPPPRRGLSSLRYGRRAPDSRSRAAHPRFPARRFGWRLSLAGVAPKEGTRHPPPQVQGRPRSQSPCSDVRHAAQGMGTGEGKPPGGSRWSPLLPCTDERGLQRVQRAWTDERSGGRISGTWHCMGRGATKDRGLATENVDFEWDTEAGGDIPPRLPWFLGGAEVLQSQPRPRPNGPRPTHPRNPGGLAGWLGQQLQGSGARPLGPCAHNTSVT